MLMDGFELTGVMDKVGVERRLLTAGENKGFLDPFSPQNPKHLEHAKVMLEGIFMPSSSVPCARGVVRD